MRISVTLITYNHEKYIVEALDGIRSQTRVPDEVVIADDGSMDATQELILEYVKKYNLESRWVLLLSKVNRGINENFQNALNHTSGDIIVGMAGDDISLPNRCQVTEQLFNEEDVLLVTCSGYVIDDKGQITGEVVHEKRIEKRVSLAIRKGNPLVMPVGHAQRRAVFEKFGPLPNDLPNEDDQVTFRGLISGGIACSPVKVFKYRVHASSASSWLRNRTSNTEYWQRFKADMLVRKRHLEYWAETLNFCSYPNSEAYKEMALKKASVYESLHNVDKTGILRRVRNVFAFSSVIGVKDIVYLVLGKSGVIFWRWLRVLLNRA